MSGVGEVRLVGAILGSRWLPLSAMALVHLLLTSALVMTRGGENALEPIALSLGFSMITLLLICAHGSFGAELRSGQLLLWIQKPVSPLVHYLRRWLLTTFVGLCLGAALAGSTALLLFPFHPSGADAILRTAPGLLVVGGVLSALVFAVSGWGAHPDSLVAVAVLFLSFPVAIGLPRSGPGWVVRYLIAPLDELVRVGEFLSGESSFGAVRSDMATVAFTAGIWILIGILGVQWRSRRAASVSNAR
jgi:hypothetical protein